MNGKGDGDVRVPVRSVCRAIRDDIVAGFHPPGSRLTEESLARRHGVSRVPVREALRTLESEGFVTVRRHAGASVAEPSEHEAADLLEMRALLEPLAAERAARRRTEAHLRVLRGLVALGRERTTARDGVPGAAPPEEWFHDTLARASGSPSLARVLTGLRRKIAWVFTVDGQAAAAHSWEEYGAIVDAVARRDAERARRAAAGHVERTAGAHRLRHPPRTAAPRGAGAR